MKIKVEKYAPMVDDFEKEIKILRKSKQINAQDVGLAIIEVNNKISENEQKKEEFLNKHKMENSRYLYYMLVIHGINNDIRYYNEILQVLTKTLKKFPKVRIENNKLV